LVLSLGALLAGFATQSTAAEAEDRVVDYRGKGEVTVSVEATQEMDAVALTIQMEQVYRKPGSLLLTLNLFGGAGLRQSFLTEGEVEQSYNPVQGVIIEKRFRNLEKVMTSPLISLHASMYDFGRKVRGAQSRRPMGMETVLGHPCDVVELDSREMFHDLSSSGLLSGQRGNELRNGRTRVWMNREFGLPMRIEIFSSGVKPIMTLVFTELKINSGVSSADLKLDVPSGARKISVTADVTDPDWEKKMEEELRRLLAKPMAQEPPAGKPAGS
jgi:outer membrane lipoprotein-sorting protein